jgi:branched-subunit amino acid ABC-type transport system permease component
MSEVSLWITLLVLVGVASFLLGMLALSVVRERRSSGVRRIWRNFGLSLAFAALFLVSWAAQGVAEWQVYASEQAEHGEQARLSEFWFQFGQSTLENWQSEFLQLFSFVVLAAVLIHHGSAESKDGTDRIEQRVNEIHSMLRDQGTA